MTGLRASQVLVVLCALAGACGVRHDVATVARTDIAALERHDAALAGALAEVREHPTADAHRRAALELIRLNVPDQAFDHLTAAIGRNSGDAVAYDARARIWRDWQMPERAFEDARRALQLAPRSAEVHNTMGTIFFALEQPGEARREFTTAISIDPAAAYAANNLCYLAFLSGDTADAEAQCQRAIALEPDLAAARQNLALVVAGTDIARAERELMVGANVARAQYNLGILHLARGEFPQASVAFDLACGAPTPVRDACARARQAKAESAKVRLP